MLICPGGRSSGRSSSRRSSKKKQLRENRKKRTQRKVEREKAARQLSQSKARELELQRQVAVLKGQLNPKPKTQPSPSLNCAIG